jgi:hypothetical protein
MIAETPPPMLSPADARRRRLLQGLAALAGSGYLPGGLAQSAPAALSTASFKAMATTLTGFAYGDPAVAGALLRGLTAAVGAASLARIAKLSASTKPEKLDDALKSAGLVEAAQAVLVALYSGVVQTSKGPVVITYDQALAWQAVPWTKPNAQCGGMTDYWSSKPANA